MTGQSLRHFNTVPVFWHNNLNYHHQMEQEWAAYSFDYPLILIVHCND